MGISFADVIKMEKSGKIRGYVIAGGRDAGKMAANGKIVAKLYKGVSPQKNSISAALFEFTQSKCVVLVEELRFAPPRKFRFDWSIDEWKIAIEYEGLTHHATIYGMRRDVEKYNLAQSLGWRVIRMNHENYLTVIDEIQKLLK